MKPKYRLGILSIVVSMSQPLAAQTWNGTSANWSIAAGWTPSGVPSAGANIIIADTTTNGLTLDGTTSRSVGSVTFGTTGTRAAAFTLNTLTANTLTIGAGVIANGALTGTTNVLTMRGNYVVSANQGWSVGGTPNSDNGVFIRGTSDSANASPTGSLVLNANLTKSGTGQLNFASVAVSGAGNLVIDAGTLKFNAGVSQPLIVGGPGNITMGGTSTLLIVKNSGTLNINRPIVMNGTSTLAPRTATVDIASAIAFNGTHTLNPDNTTNLTGAWTGSGTVNRSGSGTLNLSGSLTGFTGTLNLNAGTNNLAGPFGGSLAVTAGTTTLGGNVAGSLTLGAGATLSGEFTATGGLTLQGGTFGANPLTPASLGTTGNLNLSGSNTVALTASPSSTAPFTILSYSGTLTGGVANLSLLGGVASYRSVTFSDSTPNIITLALGSAARTWTGLSGTAWDINTTANWLEGDKKFLQLDAVTFGNAGAGDVALTGALVPASINVSSDTDYNFTGDATNYIAGGGGLTKSGLGTLTLGGVNTFNGNISVNAGILKPAGNQALGANGKTITIAAGATLDTNGAMTASRDYRAVVSGTGADGFGAIVNYGAGQAFGFLSLTLAADATIGGFGRWDVRPINPGDGLVDLAGHKLTKVGSNQVSIIDSVATANGTIDISEGTLALSRSAISGTGSVTVNPDATLYFENNTSGSFTKNLALNGGTLSAGFSTGSGTLVPIDSPQITLTGSPSFLISAPQTVTGAIVGSGSLEKNGTSTLVLTGAATHGGGTFINAGTLQIGEGLTTGSLSGDVANEGTITFNRSDTYTPPGVISGGGALVKLGTGSLILGVPNLFTGLKTISSGAVVLRSTTGLGDTAAFVRFTGSTGILDLATNTSVAPYTVTIGAGNSGTILSNVGTPGPGINHTLGYVELSTVTLNVGAGTDVSGGDPRLTLPTLNLAAGASGTTTLSPTTANITLGSASIATSNVAKTLSLSGTSLNNQVTGTITDGLNILSLTKTNDSFWTVSGDNSFTGPVNVADGVLSITHSNALGAAAKTVFAYGNASNNQFPELRFSGGISPTVAEIQTSGAGTDSATGVLCNISEDNTLTVTNQVTLRSGVGASTFYSDAGTLTINTPLVITNISNRVLNLAGPGNGVINGVIANGTTVNLPVVKNGTGTWTLNDAHTYSGTTTVNDGVLSLGQAALSDTALVEIAPLGLGKLNLNFAGTDQVGSLTINGVAKPDGLYSAATDPTFITGSGKLRVGPETGGYSTWAATNAPSPQTTGQDYDNDGVPNGAEYVLGGTASAQDSSKLPKLTTSGGNLVFTFKRIQSSKTPDTSVSIDVGTTLASWTSSYIVGNDTASSSTPFVTVTDNGDGYDNVTLTIAQAPDAKKFARLKVTVN